MADQPDKQDDQGNLVAENYSLVTERNRLEQELTQARAMRESLIKAVDTIHFLVRRMR